MHLCDIEFLDPKKTDVFFMVLSKTRDNPFVIVVMLIYVGENYARIKIKT